MRASYAAPLLMSVGLSLAGCGGSQPHDYPASAKAHFESSCPPASEVCRCTWEQITTRMSYEEYQDALDRFRDEGLMDPRISRARTHCLERHDN